MNRPCTLGQYECHRGREGAEETHRQQYPEPWHQVVAGDVARVVARDVAAMSAP